MKTIGKLLIGFIAGYMTVVSILVLNPETARHIDEMAHNK